MIKSILCHKDLMQVAQSHYLLIRNAAKSPNHFYGTDINSFFLLFNIKISENTAFSFGNLAHWEKYEMWNWNMSSVFSFPSLSRHTFATQHASLLRQQHILLMLVCFWSVDFETDITVGNNPSWLLLAGSKTKESFQYKVKPLFWQQQPPRKLLGVCVWFLYDAWPKAKPSAERVSLPGR